MRPLGESRVKYWRARFARLIDLAEEDLLRDELELLLEKLADDVKRRWPD